MPTIFITIYGKVQGVFFRASAKEIADSIGVKGWVKNTLEGNVEVLASGNDQQLEKFIEWCSRGPSNAKVTEIKVDRVNDTDAPDFSIRRF